MSYLGQRGCFGQSSLTSACNTQACSKWSDWSPFSGCTATCGGGIMAQQRECINGTPGVDCLGTHENIQMCNEQPCPVWGTWEQWSDCSVTCGKGMRSRERSCPVEKACPGDYDEVQYCGSTECRKYHHSLIEYYLNPISISKCNLASWTEWGDYSSCSKSCGGGLKQRSRACNAGFGRCGDDSPYERVACNTEACPAQWSPWTECTKKCGGGNQSRSRDCQGSCDGGNFQTTQCNQQACSK